MLTLSQVGQYVTSQAHRVIDTIGKMGTRTVKVLQSPNDKKFGVGPEMFDWLFKAIGIGILILGAAAASVAFGTGYFAAGGALATPVGITTAAVAVGGVAILAALALTLFKTKKENP